MNIATHLPAASRTLRPEKQDSLKQAAKETPKKWGTDWTKQKVEASKRWWQDIRYQEKETKASEYEHHAHQHIINRDVLWLTDLRLETKDHSHWQLLMGANTSTLFPVEKQLRKCDEDLKVNMIFFFCTLKEPFIWHLEHS